MCSRSEELRIELRVPEPQWNFEKLRELAAEKLEAAKLLSPADPARTQLYVDVQTLMLADAPAVWLAEPHLIVASSQAIGGFVWRPDQINRYYYVTKSS